VDRAHSRSFSGSESIGWRTFGVILARGIRFNGLFSSCTPGILLLGFLFQLVSFVDSWLDGDLLRGIEFKLPGLSKISSSDGIPGISPPIGFLAH